MSDEALTLPLPRADTRCGWCGIRACAVPDEPAVLYEGAWYHRRGCYPSARLVISGALPPDYKAWGAA